MSTDKWWRGPRSSGQLETRDDSTAWPGLSPSRRRPSCRDVQNNVDDVYAKIRDQAGSNDRTTVLDDEGYPKLGQRLPKRKLQDPPAGCSEDVADIEKLNANKNAGNVEDWTSRKFLKKQRRLNVIRIDLEKVLERQRSLSESQTASCPKPKIKLNLNLSIRNPLDSVRLIQCHKGIQREVPRVKKISKLKRVIFRERELKKQTNIWKRELFDIEKMQAITKDVGEIDFNKLKISGDSKPEITFVSKMSAMSLFENKYRVPPSDNVAANLPGVCKDDVTKRLESLLIRNDDKNDILPEVRDTSSQLIGKDDVETLMDSNIVAKTLCLKICDETGETVEEFEKPQLSPESINESVEYLHVASDHPTKYSKNFREYCTNDLTPGLNTSSENFLAQVYRLQRRMYERDEVKGRCRRRFYAGFKEVSKHVESKKIKFVFIAPDIEGIHGYPGGLNEVVCKLISACKLKEIVFCFALNKRKLGYYTHKKGSVSCVGIVNYDGLEGNFKEVLTELTAARNSFERRTSSKESESGASDTDNRVWNEILVSAEINLLLKNLTVKCASS